MKKRKGSINLIILSIILILISFIIIVLNGKTYIVKFNVGENIKDLDQINIQIEQDKEIIKCIEKNLKDGKLEIKIQSVNKGKAFVEYLDDTGVGNIATFYVHRFGIITDNNFFGNSTGAWIIPASISIILMYLIYLLVKRYKSHLKENLYQYKNIVYLGLIIFLCFVTIIQILSIFKYQGIIHTVRETLGAFGFFSYTMFPVAFITSILISISNIILVKNEGLNWKNLLGIILGLFFCIATLIPNFLYNILQSSIFIDIHNEQGIGTHIYLFFETVLYMIVAYLEFILLGTIVLAIKAARHIPSFDKKYILILGCKIKKDGTLTNILKSRVDRAIEFRNMQKEKTGKDLIFVPSGGQGEDEIISEAQAMKNYLIKQGIKEENILMEDKSKSTFENIKFSNNIIKEKKESEKDNRKNEETKIAFSTTNYHVFRAGAIANEQNIQMEGIGSRTKTYFWINAFIREYIATLFSEKKKHFLIISIILIITIIMVSLVYLSNIII